MAMSLGGVEEANGPSFGLSWGHGKQVGIVALVTALITALALMVPTGASAGAPTVAVIVRETPGAGQGPERLVEQLGGTIGDQLGIIEGFSAELPTSALAILEAHPNVHSVTPDSQVRLQGWDQEWDGEEGRDSFDRQRYSDGAYNDDDHAYREYEHVSNHWGTETAAPGWMALVNDAVGAMDYWAAGFTGAGVDVALIDSGVAPVNGLTVPGKVVNGLDISFESQADNLRYLDSYGHGTHMAGIIAGRDSLTNPLEAQELGEFVGVAPGARILSVKVADANGAVDVSQVIAAIDWVVQHRNDQGMNIRVLNLSFGTDGGQDYRLDPLAYAAEVAWRHGIVVVVAAGNDGNSAGRLRNPAFDPFVIAVGASDTRGTERRRDDVVADFSNCGNASRSVDLIAPGKSIESLRVPGSAADVNYPAAVVGTRFFKGSGTSQAAAVVSGAAALIIQQRPGVTPDQVKALLTETASKLWDQSALCQGEGTLNLGRALWTNTPTADQAFPGAAGNGSLELARGSAHLVDEDVILDGEQDIFGNPWTADLWAELAAAGASWSGGDWNGASWSGASWSGASWSGASWSGASWSGASWSGASWSGASWSSASWSGASWSGASWSGMSWSSASWSANVWSSRSWGSVMRARPAV